MVPNSGHYFHPGILPPVVLAPVLEIPLELIVASVGRMCSGECTVHHAANAVVAIAQVVAEFVYGLGHLERYFVPEWGVSLALDSWHFGRLIRFELILQFPDLRV